MAQKIAEAETKPAIEPDDIDSKSAAEEAAATLRKTIRYHNYRYYVEDEPLFSASIPHRIYSVLRSRIALVSVATCAARY
jgi:hypothetical protein